MPSIRTTRKSRADQLSQQYFGRPVGQIAPGGKPISVTPADVKPLPQAALPHYWHPGREGVEHCPPEFAARLANVEPNLRLVRPPLRAPVPIRCWLLWHPKAEVTHPLCRGWHLKMAWAYGKTALPLDERIFAAIYHFDARRFKNGAEYFDRVIAERNRAKEIERKDYDNNRRAEQREFRDALKIKNIGAGNKFALHHDGTIIPSRGEVAWNEERLRHTLPGKIVREEKDRRDGSGR
jgi:hypothetical protein